MSTKIFEWQDFEENVYNAESLEFPDASFSNDLYSLEAAKGFTSISLFTDCVIPDGDLISLWDSGTKIITLRAAGFDNLNVKLAKSIGFKVYRVSNYGPESIAEYVFALLLTLTRKLNVERTKHLFNDNTRDLRSMGFNLNERAIGIIGLGKIGKEVARIAKGFNMYVLYFDPYVEEYEGSEKVHSLESLFERSQFITINSPLNNETKHLINYQLFQKIKYYPFYLINTARGDIVHPDDLIKALDDGTISGAGIDTWDSGVEDDLFDERLLRDNVIQTKHVAFLTYESVRNILNDTKENLEDNPKDYNIL